MLDLIQSRDTELRLAHDGLERRVDERTLELEQEVADRQRAQEALHESEGRIRLLLDSTAEAIFGTDSDGRCTFCNPAALRMLGYSAEDLLGKCVHDKIHYALLDGTRVPRAQCQIATSLAKGEGIHSDNDVFWRADGTYFPAEYWAFPIRKEGESVGSVVTFVDITERKRAQASLLEAKDAAEAGSRAKSEFLANMSHEIRTPMNGIIGMTELALDTTLTSEQRDYLTLVKSSADSLLHIINDILDFSKIEAGKLELEETEFNLRDLFRDTLKTLAQRADSKTLELCARISPQVPTVLIGDPTRLRQLVVNLVGNAIKFTEQGTVVIDAQLEEAVADEVHLHVAVSDTGVGIPQEKHQVIFESFAQVDGSTTRRFGGTGLGLTISRQLVELMGGQMWLESEPGEGSTFHFTCHLRPGASEARHEDRLASQRLPGLKILVVDNNPVTREILTEMLLNWHMKPVAVESANAAIREIEGAQRSGQPFSVVLLDAIMPEVSGFHVLQRLQSVPVLSGAVVMLLSATNLVADTARCRELGVKYCLTKPVGQSELLDSILNVLGLGVVEERLIQSATPAPKAAPARSLNILLAEDNPVNQRLAIRLLEKAGHKVKLAETGQAAVRDWEAAGEPGFDVVLMDIQMPLMDGMEATVAIREKERQFGRHTPIVAMTAHAMRGDKEKCLAGGMDGYVSKPISPAELFAEIDRCLAQTDRRNEVPENLSELHKQSEPTEQIDRGSLLGRVEGDQELLTEMVHLFEEESPKLLAAISDALERGDVTLLERSAHSLKGAAANLSAKPLSAAALRLEQAAKSKDLESARAGLAEVERAMHLLLPALAALCQEVTK
jgi:PAS domain S-box-containing protein